MKKILPILLCFLAAAALAAFIGYRAYEKRLYPREYGDIVESAAAEQDIPESLVYSVIRAESSFRADAVSRAGAKGLMQLMPETYEWLVKKHGGSESPEDITDPAVNIRYGCLYLRSLYDRFGDWSLAVAAYNAGPNRVAGWLADSRYSDDGKTLAKIPYAETENYVNRVLSAWEKYEKLYYNKGDQ